MSNIVMHSEIVETASITNAQKDGMFDLLGQYFEGLDRQTFEADLENKQRVILLTDNDRLCGFSTLCTMENIVNDQQVRAFFSGDTIIDRKYWGSMALENAWSKFVFSQVKADPTCRWFWFLICKGYRTYRYLPVYFKRYYPCPDQVMPEFEQAVMNKLAEKRYGDHYCAQTGTIRCPQDYRLRAGVGDITNRELRDPRIAFFQEKNPDWARGVELACLAELNPVNLTRPAFRYLRGDSAR